MPYETAFLYNKLRVFGFFWLQFCTIGEPSDLWSGTRNWIILPNAPNVIIIDHDGDGLPTSWEIIHEPSLASGCSRWVWGDNSRGDLDGDGLTNQYEYALGLDPKSIDTDKDGLPIGLRFGMDCMPRMEVELANMGSLVILMGMASLTIKTESQMIRRQVALS